MFSICLLYNIVPWDYCLLIKVIGDVYMAQYPSYINVYLSLWVSKIINQLLTLSFVRCKFGLSCVHNNV